MSPTPPALARLAPLAFAAWLLGLSILPPSATRIDTWPAAGWVFAGWLVMIGLGWTSSARLRLGGGRDIAGLIFGVAALASAWFSPWRGGSLSAVLGTLAGIGLLHALVAGFRSPERARLQAALDLGAVGVIAAGLLVWSWPVVASGFTPISDLAFRNAQPFGHVNYTAGAALLASSWLAAAALGATGGARTWRGVGAGFGIVLLLSSGSRAGVAALGAGAAIFMSGLWLRRGRRSRDLVVGVIVILVVTGGAVLTNDRLRSLVRDGRWSAVASESNTQRAALATAAVELGSAHGVLGPGPGTPSLAYGALAGKSSYVGAPDGTLQVHSNPLQIWATTGPLGFLALAVLVIAWAPTVLRAVSSGGPVSQTALAAGLLAYALFSLTDHQLDVPFMLVFMVAHVARLAAPAAIERDAGTLRGLRSPLARIALVAALVGPVIQRGREVAARAAFAGAVDAHDRQRPDLALQALGHARALAPWDRFYLEANAAWQWSDPAKQAAAADALRQVVDRADPWPSEFALYNLAWLELQQGKPEALSRFAEAARFAPHRRGVHLGHALASLRERDTLAAVRALAREALANPVVVTEAWWQEPEMQALIPAVAASITTQADALADALPAGPRRDDLRASAGLIAWWLQPDARTAGSIASALEPGPAAMLLSLVAAPPKGSGPWPGAAVWGKLGQTWADGVARDAADPREAGDLTARLAASTDFLTFVTAPLSATSAWRRAERTLRGGHRVIMRHPDSPVVADVPVFERNLLLAPVVNALFPARGWIPGAAWHDAGLLP